MRKLENRIIVWPSYFDIHRSKKEGRRVPKKICVELPRIEEIAQAAKEFRPEVASETKYPKTWWMKSGYIIVGKQASKKATLEYIGQRLLDLRMSTSSKPKK